MNVPQAAATGASLLANQGITLITTARVAAVIGGDGLFRLLERQLRRPA
jgi:hypothetical protein